MELWNECIISKCLRILWILAGSLSFVLGSVDWRSPFLSPVDLTCSSCSIIRSAVAWTLSGATDSISCFLFQSSVLSPASATSCQHTSISWNKGEVALVAQVNAITFQTYTFICRVAVGVTCVNLIILIIVSKSNCILCQCFDVEWIFISFFYFIFCDFSPESNPNVTIVCFTRVWDLKQWGWQGVTAHQSAYRWLQVWKTLNQVWKTLKQALETLQVLKH